MKTITYSATLTVLTCWCGIEFAVPDNLYRRYVERDQRNLHCPHGHSCAPAGKSDAEKLRAQVTNLQDTLDACRTDRDFFRDSQRATKGHITRLKKRVAAGVCPCCKRTFQDLAKHMKGQHPEYPE